MQYEKIKNEKVKILYLIFLFKIHNTHSNLYIQHNPYQRKIPMAFFTEIE